MNHIATHARPWIAGIAIAFAGVGLARFVAPTLGGSARIAATVGGEFVALLGLFIICVGVRARVRRDASG